MLQSEPPLQEESSPEQVDRPRSRRRTLGYMVEIALLVAALVVLVSVVVFSVKLTTGVSRNIGTPSQTVRLQIVNGCGVRGAESKMADKVNGYADSNLDITVVDAGTFDLRKVTKSYIISRIQDERPARQLAASLGLTPSDVIYEPLENNVRDITATLVLGDDYYRIRTGTSEPKEK